MKLHTVFITYNRLELTKRAISSYLETVSVPFTYCVVDNGSTDGTLTWATKNVPYIHAFAENRYPGAATNFGWKWGAVQKRVTHLHRADNDFEFLHGWCEEVERMFQASKIGQLGLRMAAEERGFSNVGGNCIIRRELWDQGLRYDERPWSEYPPLYSEDSYFSPAVREMGYTVARVRRACIRSLETGSWDDPYYQRSWGDRRIPRDRDDPTRPGTL